MVKDRGISFERVIYHIERNEILDIIRHPNSSKYPNQRMFILDIGNYAYLVPFVETDSKYFLKPLFQVAKPPENILRLNVMSNKLTKEEKETLESYENDEWVSVSKPASIAKYKAAAKATFKKDKRVNIRISELDLELLRERALIEGLPYQTLMSSVLHKYVTGRFAEKNA